MDISLEERKELCWAFKTPNILADHRGANFKGELQDGVEILADSFDGHVVVVQILAHENESLILWVDEQRPFSTLCSLQDDHVLVRYAVVRYSKKLPSLHALLITDCISKIELGVRQNIGSLFDDLSPSPLDKSISDTGLEGSKVADYTGCEHHVAKQDSLLQPKSFDC